MAVRIGQALVHTKCLKISSSNDQQFKDLKDVILEIGEAGNLLHPSPTFVDAPNWFLSDDGDELSNYPARISLHEANIDTETGLASFHRKRLSEAFGDSGKKPENAKRSNIPLTIPQIVEEKAEELTPPSVQNKESTTPGHYIIPPNLSLHSVDSTSANIMSFSILDHDAVNHAISITGLSKASDASKQFEESSIYTELKRRHLIDHEKHLDAFLSQQLKTVGLSYRWLEVIKPLIMDACRKVSTNITPDDFMDIRMYCKVKKIPGGSISDCSFIHGVVFSKHVTHKKMNMSVRNPRILLLKCAFEFQRKENQLSSFDTLLSQEQEYLKNLVERVKKFRPSIIFVQKSVSRFALEMLHHHGIVVVVNIKPSVISRIARSTQTDPILNLDQLYIDVKLGTCGNFYVRTFTMSDGIRKTLIYLDDCDPKLGGVILLKGGTKSILKCVKSVVLFGLQVVHNMNLESAYLTDIFATPFPRTDRYSNDDSDNEFFTTPPDSPTLSLYRFSPSITKQDEFPFSNDYDEKVSSMSSESIPLADSGSVNDVGVSEGVVASDVEEKLLTDNQVDDDVEMMSNDDETGVNGESKDSMIEEHVALLNSEEVFQNVLSSHLISTSPYMEFTVPYLQTQQGLEANIRSYLPQILYWSHWFKPKTKHNKTFSQNVNITRPMSSLKCDSHLQHNYKSVSSHPFTNSVFLHSAKTDDFKSALADFRSRSSVPDEDNSFFFPMARKAANVYQVLSEIFEQSREFESRAGNLLISDDHNIGNVQSNDSNGNDIEIEEQQEYTDTFQSPFPSSQLPLTDLANDGYEKSLKVPQFSAVST